MAKFNTTDKRGNRATSPITSTASGATTYEGGPGFVRDPKGELFLLAVSNFVGEKTFYEDANTRDARFEALCRSVALIDPEWFAQFVPWLRNGANMRSASLVAALEGADAMRAAGKPGGRQIVASSMARADEPGEAVAYWLAKYGRKIPKPVKRGIADAAVRLYNQYALGKYDTGSRGVRFADVIDLTHPDPNPGMQTDVFRYALDSRHGRADISTDRLPIVRARMGLITEVLRHRAVDPLLDSDVLRGAGFTWEDAMSLAGQVGGDKKQLWEAMIPNMGYMALLRNLRNFDEAGVSDAVARQVADRLMDPEQVARSRQLPFRFLSAQDSVLSQRWGHALDTALQGSLANIPALGGKTLILVDTSASMSGFSFSARSKMTPAKAAALFGVALAAKGEAVDLRGFADGVFTHRVPKGASVLREVQRFVARTGEVGHGTDIPGSVQRSLQPDHTRVVVISDMQTIGGHWGGNVADIVPANVPLYGFNLQGYKQGAFAAGTGNRHEFGGLTDATFKMIPLLEAGRNAAWPWES
jgi:hypothetical protein